MKVLRATVKPEVDQLALLTLGKKDGEYDQAEFQAGNITREVIYLIKQAEELQTTFYDKIVDQYTDVENPDYKEHLKLALELSDQNEEMRKITKAMDKVAYACEMGRKQNKEKREKTQPTPMGSPAQQFTFKQPASVPIFSGKIEDWPVFWSIFDSNVDKDTTLSKCEKFCRLRSSLKEETLSLIRGLLVTDDNYQRALDLLHAKFENVTEVKKCLNKKLYSNSPKSHRIVDQKQYLGELKATIDQLEDNHIAPDATFIICNIMPKFSYTIQKTMSKYLVETPGLEKDLHSLMKQLSLAVEVIEKEGEIPLPQKQVSSQEKETRHVNTVVKQPNVTSARANGRSKCIYCGNNEHRSWECNKVTSIQERKAHLQREGRCLRCTRQGHAKKECRWAGCFNCNDLNHHSSICPVKNDQKTSGQKGVNTHTQAKSGIQQGQNSGYNKPKGIKKINSNTQAANAVSTQEQETVITNNIVSNGVIKTLLPVAQARAYDPTEDRMCNVHMLLDTGSDTTFITKTLAKQLRLESVGESKRTVKPFDTKPITKSYPIYRVALFDKQGQPCLIEALGTDEASITGKVPNIFLTEEDKKFLEMEKINLSATEDQQTLNPQILIGSDIYSQFVTVQDNKVELPQGTPLMKTKFGYVPYGPAQIRSITWVEESSVNAISDHAINTQVIPEFTPDKQEFTGPTSEEKKQISEQVWRELEETIQRVEQEDGTIRYSVRLPWIPTQERLPTNRAIAKRRLDSLYRSSTAIKGRLEQIDKYFREQLELGILEEVDELQPADGSRIHYLPNMPVLRPDSKTHPLRMVMDASAHYVNEPCLNDLLYPGPLLLPNLAGNLLRFRTRKYALIADIERAFLQVKMQPCDRDVSRTLWVKDINLPPTENNLWVLRHTTVLFGLNCAPFLLAATIIHHVKRSKILTEDLRNELLNNTYVDNIMCTADSEEEILEKYKKLKEFFNSMRMNLRSFSSNASSAMQAMAEADKESEQVVKILGLQWNTRTDTMRIKSCTISDMVSTKAEVSAALGMSFDPMGLLVPILLPAKTFLQEMWEKGLDWNDEMPSEMKERWNRIWQQIQDISIEVPRHAAKVNPKKHSKLLVFSDSSEAAMGCCIYLQQEDQRDLVMGKSKLLNKRILFTIPKAELSALTMACLLTKFALDQLRHSIAIGKVTLLCDNQAVLGWLQEPPSLKEGAFVRNRLREINSIVSMLRDENIEIKFGYVSTNSNIADCCTKNNFNSIWSQEVWLKGPPQIDSEVANGKLFELRDSEGEEGVPDYAQVNMIAQQEENLLVNLSNFSSFKRAIATVATVIRFIKRAS